MRYVSLKNVKQGDKLAKHIFANDGRVLLNEGVPLTIGLISKLRYMGVSSVFIKDERFEDIEVEEVISDKTKREAISLLADSVQYIQENNTFDHQSISNIVNAMIDETVANTEVLFHLTDVRTKDNDLFVHSVNVCILSLLIGIKLNLNQIKLKELAMGALLHDIGKINKKSDEKTENDKKDEIDHHSWIGFNLLRKNPGISTLSAHVALAHHENVDGTGQPRGMEDADIHLLAKIVAVANDYDRLVAHKEDEVHLMPYEACERIMGLTNIRYDHDVVWNFLRCVAFYPTGSQVKLSNNKIGIVVGQHYGLPQRPIVRTYSMGDRDVPFEEIDLAKETTIFINNIVE